MPGQEMARRAGTWPVMRTDVTCTLKVLHKNIKSYQVLHLPMKKRKLFRTFILKSEDRG